MPRSVSKERRCINGGLFHVNQAAKLIAIDHDDYHAEFVGKTADMRWKPSDLSQFVRGAFK